MTPTLDAAVIMVHDEYEGEQKSEQVCCDPVALSEMQSGCLDNAIAGLSQVHMEYTTVAGIGTDNNNNNNGATASLEDYKRFKRLAADLVTQKKEEIQKSIVLGDEKMVIQEESVEIVKGTYLQELTGETCTTVERNAIHAITVGELLLKMEV